MNSYRVVWLKRRSEPPFFILALVSSVRVYGHLCYLTSGHSHSKQSKKWPNSHMTPSQPFDLPDQTKSESDGCREDQSVFHSLLKGHNPRPTTFLPRCWQVAPPFHFRGCKMTPRKESFDRNMLRLPQTESHQHPFLLIGAYSLLPLPQVTGKRS